MLRIKGTSRGKASVCVREEALESAIHDWTTYYTLVYPETACISSRAFVLVEGTPEMEFRSVLVERAPEIMEFRSIHGFHYSYQMGYGRRWGSKRLAKRHC